MKNSQSVNNKKNKNKNKKKKKKRKNEEEFEEFEEEETFNENIKIRKYNNSSKKNYCPIEKYKFNKNKEE